MVERPSANAGESPAITTHAENTDGQIDEQMRGLVRRLGELVGRPLAADVRSEPEQNEIPKNRGPG